MDTEDDVEILVGRNWEIRPFRDIKNGTWFRAIGDNTVEYLAEGDAELIDGGSDWGVSAVALKKKRSD